LPNKYKCSNGELVSEATIAKRRSEAYRRMYEGEPHPNCIGCNARAQCTIHFVPQKYLKGIGKTEYCWKEVNMGPGCFTCNSILESIRGEDVKKLLCYDRLLEVTKLIAPERYNLMIE